MSEIKCENICKSFGIGPSKVDAVRGITSSFSTGVFYSIIGKSGSGKSTLLHLLSGILSPSSGRIYYDGVALDSLNKREMEKLRRTQVGFIFQDYQLLPELTVRENIILPLILNQSPVDNNWCSTILERLEIKDIANKYPQELSGGQQQRVAIGRAMVHRPPYIFADEPTGNLDKKTRESVLNLLVEARSLYDPMILLVTHDLDIARSADLVLYLEDGKLCTPQNEVAK